MLSNENSFQALALFLTVFSEAANIKNITIFNVPAKAGFWFMIRFECSLAGATHVTTQRGKVVTDWSGKEAVC